MIKVTLREKKLKGGKRGLYLDFWPPIVNPETLKPTRREHLKLYVFERPKNETEKQENKETRLLGESLRSKRQLELQAGVYGFLASRNRNKNFIEYFRQYAETKKPHKEDESKSSYDNWQSVLKHLKAYAGEVVRFGDVDEAFCEGFKTYLLKSDKINSNTAAAYFDKFKGLVRKAFEDRLFAENPARKVKSIPIIDPEREFLSLEELHALAAAPFPKYDNLRRAFLFGCLTGLRFSDIQKLTWSEIRHSAQDGYFIRFKQKKTGQSETQLISGEARELLGEQSEAGERIFQNLKYSQCIYLPVWMAKAGITREINFHASRHTYATLQLSLGADLRTVQLLLGHKDSRTTQRYAHVLDERKKQAANRISLK